MPEFAWLHLIRPLQSSSHTLTPQYILSSMENSISPLSFPVVETTLCKSSSSSYILTTISPRPFRSYFHGNLPGHSPQPTDTHTITQILTTFDPPPFCQLASAKWWFIHKLGLVWRMPRSHPYFLLTRNPSTSDTEILKILSKHNTHSQSIHPHHNSHPTPSSPIIGLQSLLFSFNMKTG